MVDKDLVMTKEDENFQDSTKCWICESDSIDGDFKVRDHCHITGKHRGSSHTDCNINVKSNHKIPVVFHNSYFTSYYGRTRQIQPRNKCHTEWIRKIFDL